MAQAIWAAAATLVLTAPFAMAAPPPNPAPSPILPPLAPGQVVRVGPVAGTGTSTGDFGVGATDLCEFIDFRTELQQICGDSFAGQGVGFGRWFTPVAPDWRSLCWPSPHLRVPHSCRPVSSRSTGRTI